MEDNKNTKQTLNAEVIARCITEEFEVFIIDIREKYNIGYSEICDIIKKSIIHTEEMNNEWDAKMAEYNAQEETEGFDKSWKENSI